MEFKELDLKGVFLITPQVFGDERGFFKEVYNEKTFKENGLDLKFVQDNHSRSGKNILRGIHWQRSSHAQDKLVRVVKGKVLDVAVDLRQGSPTFSKHVAVELSEENHRMLLVPKGFGHGFLTLTEQVDFEYKVTDFYAPDSEAGILWNDPDLGIDWGVENPVLSEKDKELPKLKDLPKEDLFD